MHERRIEQAAGYGDVALEPVLRVEYRDVELLDRKILQTLREDLVNVARPAHRHSFLPFLRRHAASQLERGMDANRTSRSYTPYARKSGDRLRRQQPQRSPAGGKNLLPYSDGGAALGSASEQYRDKLAGAQRVRAVTA